MRVFRTALVLVLVLVLVLATACATPSSSSSSSPSLGRRKIDPAWKAPAHGPVRVAFFDADDTLRRTLSGKPSPQGPADVELIPSVAYAVARTAREGYLVAIVSNQAGIEAGHVSIDDVDAAFRKTVELIGEHAVAWYDYAEQHDDHRKPQTGMAAELERALVEKYGSEFHIDKAQSFMVGDDLKGADSGFAKNLGIRFMTAAEFFGADVDD